MKNEITLVGEVQEIDASFESYNQTFYQLLLGVKRLSGAIDYIPVIYKPIPNVNINVLDRIKVTGEIRTRNVKVNDEKSKLKLYVYGSVEITDEPDDYNKFEVDGYICKLPSNRKTPRGIDVTDIMVAYNTVNKRKSYYFPVIAFGKEAIRANSLVPGNIVNITGRFQSRDYNKTTEAGTFIYTAYELALATFSTDVKDDSIEA